MKIKCEYCKSYISEHDEKCPNCGANNANFVREAKEEPKTIEELKQWYKDRNLPDENVTRFFIGKDYQEPKAFGIYKDNSTGNFVVYKNKANGQRAIRYEGEDEAYAVNELYQKLKSEIANQKSHQKNRKPTKEEKVLAGFFWILAVVVVIMSFAIGGLIHNANRFSRGYYKYNNNYYYQQGGNWYVYDDSWKQSRYVPDDLKENYKEYYQSSDYHSYYGTSDFSDTSYYKEYEEHWDSSSDWDSDSSWDSSSTDWDSDW